jgi:hypothetical protein
MLVWQQSAAMSRHSDWLIYPSGVRPQLPFASNAKLLANDRNVETDGIHTLGKFQQG